MLIVTGVIGIVWGTGGSIGTTQNIGHLLFLGSALGLGLLHGRPASRPSRRPARCGHLCCRFGASLRAAICLVAGASLFEASPGAIALQALVQGLLTAVISYVLYGRAVSILGASSGAAFAALCPAMTALMAIPVLGEWPSAIDWMAIILISIGVYVVSGGPLRGLRA